MKIIRIKKWNKQWFLNGVRYTEEQFYKKTTKVFSQNADKICEQSIKELKND